MPLGTLLDSHDRARLVQRLNGVRPDAAAVRGRLCWKHLDHHLTQFGA